MKKLFFVTLIILLAASLAFGAPPSPPASTPTAAQVVGQWASGSCTGLLNSDGTCKAIGTNVQAYDAELSALAGLTSAANAIPYFTGSGTAGVISSSDDMVALLGSADYATARTNMGTWGVSGSITDEQLVCGETTGGTNLLKSCGAKTTINDSAGNGDTTVTWSADKIYDQLALKQATLTGSVDITVKSVTIAKQSGTAGNSCVYEANSTDTNMVCNRGPANRAGTDLYLQYPDGDPAANQFLLYPAPTATVSTGVWTTYGQFGALPVNTNSYVTGLMPSIVVQTASGTDSASSAAAFLTHSTDSSAENAYVGMTLYNITDGSSCTVTASTATTITCTLAGGTDNHWDSGNVYQLGPGPAQSGSWIYVVAASTIRHPATAGYTVCYESDATAVLTVDMASSNMIFQGVLDTAVTALDAGDSIDSSGSTTGDFMCIHNKSATEAQGKGKRGTWVDGGAS